MAAMWTIWCAPSSTPYMLLRKANTCLLYRDIATDHQLRASAGGLREGASLW